jgi:hypothetical protein
MKTLLVCCILLISMASAQDRPIAGRPYTISYDALKAGILSDANAITIVFVFEYWSTRAISKSTASFLFGNVVDPDPTRVHRVAMKRNGSIWKSDIDIPADATLISYYFTGGEKNDYNNNNTYVSYIYNEQGVPVRNARFRNISFLTMAQKGTLEQLAEITAELKAYPDNYVARIPFWMLRFDTASSAASLKSIEKAVNDEFGDLEKKLGATDTLMNTKAGVLYRYIMKVREWGTGWEEPVVQEFKRIVEAIPPARRFRYIASIYANWFGGY